MKSLAMRRVFYGVDGLRAGWSLLLFFLPIAVLLGVGTALAHHFTHQPAAHPAPATAPQSHALRPAVVLVGETVSFALLALCALLVAKVEKRPFGSYGLGLGSGCVRQALADFGAGLGWGLTALTALVAGLMAVHGIAFSGLALGATRGLGYGVAWLGAFLGVAFFEEFGFRGFLQFTLARGVSGMLRAWRPSAPWTHAAGFGIAALVLSVGLFLVAHIGNAGETPAGIAAVGLAGIVFAAALWRTGTLWWAIGFHAAWDWAQSFLYGTADSGTPAEGHLLNSHPTGPTLWSGGSAGPEGSVLVLPVLLLVLVVIHVTLPRRRYPLPPSQREPHEPLDQPLGDPEALPL